MSACNRRIIRAPGTERDVMTDHPRFRTVWSDPDHAHRAHHGAPLVELVLRLVDRWLARRGRIGCTDTGSTAAIITHV